MIVIYILLLLAACLCFGAAAFAADRAPRVNLVALGLLFATLVPLIEKLSRAID
jgi:hypothetical protein